MKLRLPYLLLSVATVVATTTLSPYYTTKAANCKDYDILFARGSGSELKAKDEVAWRTNLKNELRNTGLTYEFYELGEKSYNGASYPALSIGFENLQTITNTASAALSVAKIGSFNASVDEGTEEALGYMESVAKSCPGTKFIIGGYSQGAMVVGRTLKRLADERVPLAKKLAYAATFGDPNLYLPEGEGLFPDACRGKNFSRYRIYAPNCRAHAGLLGTNNPYEPSEIFAGKVGLWCTKKDIFCSNAIDPSNPLSDHLAYESMSLYSEAAKQIAKKLVKSSSTFVTPTTSGTQDVAFLIDTTGSMSGYINSYAQAAKRLAKNVLERGGRIALFEYRDLDDPFKTHKILDFGSTYDEFEKAFGNLTTENGGDDPESALSAILFAMNNLNWKKSSLKSIVLLTDAGYHNPDRDGTTLADVVNRSLEIDPVSTYPITDPSLTDDYAELAQKTGGQTFIVDSQSELSTDYLLARPEVSLALEEYSGRPGEEFTFTAFSDEEGLTYDWDLDLDGEFELENAGPEVSKIYGSNTEGFVQVRAKNSTGGSSTMSAKLTVTNSTETPPEITDLNLVLGSSESNLSFNTTGALTAISVDGAPLALTSARTIALSDLTSETTLTLTPISASGLKGEPKTISYRAKTILAPKCGQK